MKNEKTHFVADYHTVPANLVKEKSFKVRAKLRKALASYLEPLLPTHFNSESQATGLLAQQLAFLPIVKSGWGPSEIDIQTVAKDMVDCYLAHLEGFAQEEFPAPAQAAFEALRDFGFSV